MASRIATHLWEHEEDKKFVDGLRRMTNALRAAGITEDAQRAMTVDQLWGVWEDLAHIKASARRI